MKFVPLNVFTNYALLKSALTLDEYFKMLKKAKIKVAGVSDPDFLFSYPHFNKMALSAKVKPLFGVRLQIEDTELVFYIKNAAGYADLMALYEVKNNDGFSASTLKNLTANLVTILPTSNLKRLELNRDSYRDYFKKWAMVTSDFYIGLENETTEFSNVLRQFADEYNYNIVAFPHILYAEPHDLLTYKMIEAIREAATLNINETFNGENYFLSNDDLANIYLEEEIKNSLKISETITFTFASTHELNLPLPAQYDANQRIKELTYNGLKKYGLHNKTPYIERLNYELEIISSLNFTNYFLLVSDYVNWAKDSGILVGYGRGSAPGSLVSYALGITYVDPLAHGLLFERFLNPARLTMPDIDIDFMDTRRQEVIDYIKSVYGEEKVAQIVTFQTNAAKASLRDAGRIFSIDLKFINMLSNSLGNQGLSLRESYKRIPAFKKLVDADKYNLEIIKRAVKLEGFPRQSGVHAAGIILDGEPLSKSLPTFFHNKARMTQYEMGFLEEQGFLKVDILGLSNLTFIHNIIERVKQETGDDLDFYAFSFEDPTIYDVILKGHTLGLFQLESDGMRKAIRTIKPTNFDDVSALLALYRPGPMQYISDYAKVKHGTMQVTYLNEEIKAILAPTYGIIIYQEQIMQIAEVMAGFTLAEADLLRRAISKKDESIILEQKQSFLKGATSKGYSEKDATKVFNDILKFADYGFNKSHSVVYAMTTMALALLKTKYPFAFYAELLPTVIGDEKKFQQLRQELKAQNINLLLPDVNKSMTSFVNEHNNLRLPLNAIIGVSMNSAHEIIRLRSEKVFTTSEDFFFRAFSANIKEDEVIALIEGGALDAFDVNRAYLKAKLTAYLPTLETRLFTSAAALSEIIVEDVSEDNMTKINEEVMRLRFPLSNNPFNLVKVKDHLPLHKALTKYGFVKTFGLITTMREIKTRKGEQMAFATLSDYDDTISLVIFPKVFTTILPLQKNIIYTVSGYLEHKDGAPQLVVNTIERFNHE